MEQVYDDALWKTLEKLKSEGKVRYYGIALGPAIGWLYEGVNCIRERDLTSVQHIYNMLEQHPGRAFHDAATEAGKDTMFLIRVTHSSGMLEGKYTAETKFPPTDHRSHRPRSWLLNGVKKVEQLRFLENASARLDKQRCNGCSRMIASLRRCRTFTTKNSSSNSQKRPRPRR
jgi:aryl-alcohol dehydrogenase-like predicted oxidoreductase